MGFIIPSKRMPGSCLKIVQNGFFPHPLKFTEDNYNHTWVLCLLVFAYVMLVQGWVSFGKTLYWEVWPKFVGQVKLRFQLGKFCHFTLGLLDETRHFCKCLPNPIRLRNCAIWINVRGLFKKYPDWNCSGCSLGGMCLQPVLTCSYMS